MTRNLRIYLSLPTALAIVGLLIWQTALAPPGLETILLAAFFLLLTVFTNTFGVPIGGGRVSLLPMIAVSAFLVLGLVPAAWVAFLGALLQEVVRYAWAQRLQMHREAGSWSAVGLATANAIIQTCSILAGGAVFVLLGGQVPLTGVAMADAPRLVLLGLAYVTVNYLLAGVYLALRSRAALRFYLRSLPNLFLYEAAPLVFAPLMALIYTQLGTAAFVLFALILVLASLITYNLAVTGQRLERRVRELDSLQEVGKALSASLDLDTIVSAIHTQVGRLMPADNAYIALYHRETDEVSFPLAVEDGQAVRWRSRRAGRGLTEHILRTGRPLLIQKDLEGTLREIGVERIGRPAVSWLGVPILAGSEPLGVIAVQSFSPRELYDRSHQEVLATIAAAAAVAIQNARLYARTDEALAGRVQELDSILRTTSEGLLLLDRDWIVVAANRALANFLGLAQEELAGQSLPAAAADGRSLLARMGYSEDELLADCQAVAEGQLPNKKQSVVLPGPANWPVERTLTPVHDREGAISGWLLVLRDVTEERELEQLREEMTHLLVHDLRSPLTVIKGGLDTIRLLLPPGGSADVGQILDAAQRSGEQMLSLVNQILDINKLEKGRLSVIPEPVEVEPLLEEVAGRIGPLAAAVEIDLQLSVEPGLPPLELDRVVMARVLHNLLDNAIKFTPDRGQVRLWARRAPDGTAVLLGVSDSGPGIPVEVRGDLFKKYRQLPAPSARRRGSGLGLYFCKLAVEAHGGQIGLEDAGPGSTFVVRLPLSPP